jgi:hypothetical protein
VEGVVELNESSDVLRFRDWSLRAAKLYSRL